MSSSSPPGGIVGLSGTWTPQTQQDELMHLQQPCVHIPFGHKPLHLPLLFIVQWLPVLSRVPKEWLLCLDREQHEKELGIASLMDSNTTVIVVVVSVGKVHLN